MIILKMPQAYRRLLKKVYDHGLTETNARTGVDIKALEGASSFKLDLSNGRLPVAGNRRYWPRVAAAETAWQFMGTQDPEWIISKAPKVWSDFVEDGKLKAAYGYRWRKHFGRDQLAMAIYELSGNPTNRQLFISAWDPSTDGLGGADQPKNIPCPVGFTLSRIENKIHCSVFIRSSDVFVGLPYDVMGYALTLDAIAASCNCAPGTLHFTLAHPHSYAPHNEAIYDCIYGLQKQWTTPVEPNLPGWSVEEIVDSPDTYVAHVKRLADRVSHCSWNPMPTLVL